MPELACFAQENVNFTQHMSSGNTTDSGMFGLFYGISLASMDGVLSARIPAALITAFNQQGYQLGLFSPMASAARLYRRALLSGFRCQMRKRKAMSKRRPVDWLAQSLCRDETAGSHGFRLNGTTLDNSQQQKLRASLQSCGGDADSQISRVLSALSDAGKLDNTVVIITAAHGMPLNPQRGKFDWSREQRRCRWLFTGRIPAQNIATLTSNKDVMTTLMQRLLHRFPRLPTNIRRVKTCSAPRVAGPR